MANKTTKDRITEIFSRSEGSVNTGRKASARDKISHIFSQYDSVYKPKTSSLSTEPKQPATTTTNVKSSVLYTKYNGTSFDKKMKDSDILENGNPAVGGNTRKYFNQALPEQYRGMPSKKDLYNKTFDSPEEQAKMLRDYAYQTGRSEELQETYDKKKAELEQTYGAEREELARKGTRYSDEAWAELVDKRSSDRLSELKYWLDEAKKREDSEQKANNARYYLSLNDNPDFESESRAVKPKVKEIGALKSEYATGYHSQNEADLAKAIESIGAYRAYYGMNGDTVTPIGSNKNPIERATDKIKQDFGAIFNPEISYKSTELTSDIYHKYMTQNEYERLVYLFNTEGAAAARGYMAFLEPYLEERKQGVAQETHDEMAMYIGDTGADVVNTVNTVLATPFVAAENTFSAVNRLGGVEMGTPLSDEKSAFRSAVTSDMGTVGKFSYGIATSILDTLVSTATGAAITNIAGKGSAVAEGASKFEQFQNTIRDSEKLTRGIIAASTFGDTYNNAIERGLSEKQALALALAGAGAEYFTEAIGIDAFLGDPKNAFLYILKNMGAEGAEEGLASIASTLSDALISGGNSEIRERIDDLMYRGGMDEADAFAKAFTEWAAEAGLETLAGAISGAIFGVGGSAVYSSYNKVGKSYNKPPSKTISGSKTTKDIDAINATSEIINSKLGEDSKAREDFNKVKEKFDSGKKVSDTELGMAVSRAYNELIESGDKESAKMIERVPTISRFTREFGKQKAESSMKLDDLMASSASLDEDTSTTAAKRILGNEMMKGEFRGISGLDLRGDEAENIEAVKKFAKSYGVVDEHDSATVAISPDDIGEIKAVNKDGVAIVDTPNGEMPVSSLILPQGMAEVYNAAGRYDTEGARVFVENYFDQPLDMPGGVPFGTYSNAFRVLNEWGKQGVSWDVVQEEASAFIEQIGYTASLAAYKSGARFEARSKSEVKTPTIKKKGEGKVEGEAKTNDHEIVFKAVAKELGVDIEVSTELNSGAQFIASIGKIVIAEGAKDQYTSLLHEVGEFTDLFNHSEAVAVRDAVLEWYAKTKGVNKLDDLIQTYQKRYAEEEGSKTYDSARTELFNDALGALFSTEDGATQFVEWLDGNVSESQKKTILDKLVEFLNKIIDAISNVIRKADLSPTQQSFLEMEADLANKIRAQFLDALSGAVESYNAAEVTSEGVENVRSQVELENGNKYSLKGTPSPTWEELEAKDPIKVIDISSPQTAGTFADRRRAILEKAKEIIKRPYLNKDTKTLIFLTEKSYTHAFNNIGEIQLNASEHLSEFVENAVLTHIEKPTHGNEYATDVFTFFAAAKSSSVLPVKLKVKAYDYRGQDIPQNIKEYFGTTPKNYTDSYDTAVLEVEEIEKSPLGSVKDIDQKDLFLDPKELYEISITDLLDLVKGENRKYLPGGIRNQIEIDTEADLSLGADEALKQAQVDFIEEMKQTVDPNSRVLPSAARVNAQEWINEYKSAYSLESLTNDLTQLYKMIGRNENYSVIENYARTIAERVVESSAKRENASNAEKTLLNELRNVPIKVTREQIAAIEETYNISFDEFKKRSALSFADNGIGATKRHEQLAETYPDVFGKLGKSSDSVLYLNEALNDVRDRYVGDLRVSDEAAVLGAKLVFSYADLAETETFADKLVKRERAKYEVKAEQIRKRYEEKLANSSDRIARMRDSRDKKQYLRSLSRVVKNLDKKLLKPKDDNLIPDAFKPTVAKVLEHFAGTSVFPGRDAWELTKTYRALGATKANNLDDFDANETDIDNCLKAIDAIFAEEGDHSLGEFNSANIKQLYDEIKSIAHIISNGMKIFKGDRSASINEIAETIVAEANEHENVSALSESAVGKAFDAMLKKGQLTPEYFFQQMPAEMRESVWNELVEAQDEWARIIQEGKDVLYGLQKEYDYKHWRKDRIDVVIEGETKRLPIQQVMSLYALYQREQTDTLNQSRHLSEGGINFKKDIVVKKVNGKKEVQFKVQALKPSKAELENAIAKLTPEQRGYVNKAVWYMSNTLAKYGNKVTLKLLGVEKFKSNFYFPYTLSDSYKKAPTDEPEPYMGINFGFTKSLIKKAATPVVLDNFTEVVSKHISEMATFASFKIPIENMNRIINWVNPDDRNINMRTVLKQKYGSSATEYINTLMRDIVGGITNDSRENIFTKGLSRFRKTAVMASLTVGLQQHPTVIRAMSEIDYHHFVGTGVQAIFTDARKEMYERAPVAFIKQLGGFDMSSMGSVQEFLAGKSDFGWGKAGSVLDNTLFLGFLPNAMDALAWAQIWAATKRETNAKIENGTLSGVEIGSDEYFDLVNERFREVINKTQVYNSVLAKSHSMRSKSFGAKLVTSFMAEPTLVYNMLFLNKSGIKKKARIIFTVAISQLIGSMLRALAAAARDDDEEASYLEKWAKSASGNFVSNINPANMIPGISQIMSLFDGYSVENSAFEVYEGVVKSILECTKAEGGRESFDAHMKLAANVAEAFGIPAENLMRELKAVYNLFDTEYKASLEEINAAVKEGAIDNLPITRIVAGMLEDIPGLERVIDLDFSTKGRIDAAYEDVEAGDLSTARELTSEMIEDAEKKRRAEYPNEKPKDTTRKAKTSVRSRVTSFFKKKYIKAKEENDIDTIYSIREYLRATGLYDNVADTLNDWWEDYEDELELKGIE